MKHLSLFVKTTGLATLAGLFFLAAPKQAGSANDPLRLRVHTVRLNVDDLDKALRFYQQTLGFEVENREPQQATLKTNGRVRLSLHKVAGLLKPEANQTRVSLTLQVNNLDEAIVRLTAKGVRFASKERRTEGVGFAITIIDPFERYISLMQITVGKVEPFAEPKIYNFGYYVPEMQAAREFYCGKLGFVALSEKYLPKDLPLGQAQGGFAFMLHYREGVKPVPVSSASAQPLNTLVYATDNLPAAMEQLKARNVNFTTLKKKGEKDRVRFTDPFGNPSELMVELITEPVGTEK